MTEEIILKGLRQNNLKDITLTIPKQKITVFTGVSGSGKSSIVFDTIAAEASRQMNDTYPAFIRSRLPKFPKPEFDEIRNLSPAVVIDQSGLGSNARSTVGTASEIYSGLRLLFSRFGEPYAGPASFFSFNDPAGMCPECNGLGEVTDIDLDKIIDRNLTLNTGALLGSMLRPNSWYWKQYIRSGRFDADKPLRDWPDRDLRLLLNGPELPEKGPKKPEFMGLLDIYRRRILHRDSENVHVENAQEILKRSRCPMCNGRRLNRIALSCWFEGYNISDLCEMELTELRAFLGALKLPAATDLLKSITDSLDRMIDIGLGYLSLDRPVDTLSGGEAQRVKLVRFLGSSLSDMLYIFDEPSTGMHPRDVFRMNRLLRALRDRGNTVLVVEHDPDVIAIADHVIDVGPGAGTEGGRILFEGSYPELIQKDTPTGRALRAPAAVNRNPRKPTGFLPVRGAMLHNLRHCDADLPLGVITAVTGAAGSGKSSLMQVFSDNYPDRVVKIDQKPITATNRSTPASFLGFMDEIRKEFARDTGAPEGMFSFNSLGACPHCKGKGRIVTELAFMDPIVTVCEECNGSRYSAEALSYRLRGKNILEVLSMTSQEAPAFFSSEKIRKSLRAMNEVGLSYLTLGQPLSTLSGGERQRLKLARNLRKKGNIYLLDEPTTGLHPSDIGRLMGLFSRLIDKGNTVVLIEHCTEVMLLADYIIDVGPDGGTNGGNVVFSGTPEEMLKSSDTITARCLRLTEAGKHATDEELRKMTAVLPKEEEEDMSGMRLRPIGRIVREDGDYRLVLDRKYGEALNGLAGFSHLQVLWWFDGCDNSSDRSRHTEEKPYTNGPESLGTFATRSPARPNPIALSTCEILQVDEEKATVRLSYIDAINGTPVLDLKPYTPSADRVEAPSVPGWCGHWPKSYETSGDFDWEKEFNF